MLMVRAQLRARPIKDLRLYQYDRSCINTTFPKDSTAHTIYIAGKPQRACHNDIRIICGFSHDG